MPCLLYRKKYVVVTPLSPEKKETSCWYPRSTKKEIPYPRSTGAIFSHERKQRDTKW
jgi:hypothetical protein